MPSTFFGLSISKSGIYTANAGINTTAHNISNAETDGYSRQVIKQSASVPFKVNSTYGMAGTGSDVYGVERVRNEYYDLKYWTNNTLAGSYNSKSYYMRQMENYFNEIQLEGFTRTFDIFYDSIQELTKNPAEPAVRASVTNNALTFCDYFNFVSESLERVQIEANFEIQNQVTRINAIADQLAVLSRQINQSEINGVRANDLRDKRDLLIDDLSGIVEVSVSETKVGVGMGVNNYVVKLGGNVLVDDFVTHHMVLVPRKEKINQSDADGLFDIEWDTGSMVNVHSSRLNGTLQALFEVRDGNNNAAFSGHAEASDGIITFTSTNYNEVDKLTLAENSTIRIGNNVFVYDGFEVIKTTNDDTGEPEFIYRFSVDEDVTPITVDMEGYGMIGTNIAFRGIPYYMAQMNEFVRTYSREFNNIHKGGQDLNGERGLDVFNARSTVGGANYAFVGYGDWDPDGSGWNPDEIDWDDVGRYYDDISMLDDGQVVFDSKSGSIFGARHVEDEENYGRNFGSYYFMTIRNITVTESIRLDVYKVAAASSILDGIENADNANAMLDLKYKVDMFRQGSPTQFLHTLVVDLAVDASKSNRFAKNQEDIIVAVNNQRLSISGVDSDEEAMNLVKYQHAYNLSAKVISVMDQLYDRLINYMGA